MLVQIHKKMAGESIITFSCHLIAFLFNKKMRIHMAVKATGHFIMHGSGMRLSVTGLALGHIRMLTTVAEGTGKCLVLGHSFLHQIANFFVACNAECSRRCHGIFNLQRMMRRVTTQTVTCNLLRNMGFMTFGAIGDLAVYLMTERTGLLRMGALKIGKVLTWSFMAGKARLFYIIGKIQGKRLMGIGMAGKAVIQFKVGLTFMAHGASGYDILTPGRMLPMAVKTGNCCLVFAAVTCD